MKLSKMFKLSTGIATVMALSPTFANAVIDEMVVTAQKREQSLQDIGVSVTAFSGAELQKLGYNQAVDLSDQTPGLISTNSQGSAYPVFAIRGVGIQDFNPNSNPGVAVYVDEVFQPFAPMLSFGLFDTDRVEVLKGPQGTLYGRNTTGGAISFISKRPTEELDGYVKVDLGNYKYKNVEAAIGGPISDRVRGRLSGFMTKQDEGHQTNVLTGDDHGEVDRWALRGQVAFDVTENIDVLLRYNHGEDQSDIKNLALRGQSELAAARAFYYTSYVGPIGHHDVLLDNSLSENALDNTADSFGAIINVDFDSVTLTSVTSYDKMDSYMDLSGESVETNVFDTIFDNEIEQISQEVRLTSNDNELVDWILGAYYAKNEVDTKDEQDLSNGIGFTLFSYGLVPAPYFEAINTYKQETESIGVFAHTEWNIAEQWKLTVAARYGRDEAKFRSQFVDQTTLAAPLNPPTDDPDGAFTTFLNYLDGGSRSGGIIASQDDSDSETSFSWRLGLDYMPNDDWLLYANVATGFKAQGYFGGGITASSALQAYKPEEILAYEAGFKSTLADGTMQLNAAAFMYIYDDQQITVGTDQGLPFSVIITSNVAESEIKGFELEWLWQPTDGFLARFGAAYLDTEITDASLPSFVTPFPGENVSNGDILANSPEWTVSGLVRYEHPVGNGLLGSVQADFAYVDDYLAQAGADVTDIDSRTTANARLALSDEEGRWELALWGRNIFDEKYSTYTYFSATNHNDVRGAPRTYGVSLTYNFQ